MTTTTTTTDRAGLYYLAPADDPRDAYAAGYDGNAFATADEAAAAIADLVDSIGGDWIVCRYAPAPCAKCATAVCEECGEPVRCGAYDHAGRYRCDDCLDCGCCGGPGRCERRE